MNSLSEGSMNPNLIQKPSQTLSHGVTISRRNPNDPIKLPEASKHVEELINVHKTKTKEVKNIAAKGPSKITKITAPTNLTVKGKKVGIRKVTTATKKEDNSMMDLLLRMNENLNEVKDKIVKIEEKFDIKRIEAIEEVTKTNKDDIETITLETTYMREELDTQKEIIHTIESRIKEIEGVVEGPSQQGYREVLEKEIAEIVFQKVQGNASCQQEPEQRITQNKNGLLSEIIHVNQVLLCCH